MEVCGVFICVLIQAHHGNTYSERTKVTTGTSKNTMAILKDL